MVKLSTTCSVLAAMAPPTRAHTDGHNDAQPTITTTVTIWVVNSNTLTLRAFKWRSAATTLVERSEPIRTLPVARAGIKYSNSGSS
jgi:hypothetical protein